MSKFKESLEKKITISPRESIKRLLDKESCADFEASLKDHAITSAAIGATLRELGVQVSNMTVQRWR